jgi:hypothetical protein
MITTKAQSQTNIAIHCDQKKYTLSGGIGASWHAISKDRIDESLEYKYALRYAHSRGSAWGGNPPVSNKHAWKQINKYASWLGLSWLRVELSMRMYEPERNQFDWDNEEMLALYNILNWAEANNADVFLQQMWSNVKWNAYQDVQPLLSAPKSLDDFADGLVKLIEHLLNEKKYTCIKWLCITNEPPGGSWGSWWSMGKKDAPITPALKTVRRALDEKNIKLPLSGPDWTDLPQFDAKKIDFDEYIGAYDIHSYHGIDDAKQKILEEWITWARDHEKPLFLSEIGDMNLGWRDSNPGPMLFQAALSNAESILRGMAVGVSAFNRWSYTNRGDLDGQWQLIRTWDMENKKYYDKVEIEPIAFYCYGILTRFAFKDSSVVFTETINNTNILSQSFISPGGEITTYIINKSNKEQLIKLTISGISNQHFFLYNVTESEIVKSDYKMNPLREIIIKDGEEIILTIPSKSINTLTHLFMLHKELAKNK